MKGREERRRSARSRGTEARGQRRGAWLQAVALAAGIGLSGAACRVERTSVVEPPVSVGSQDEFGTAVSQAETEGKTLAIGGRRAGLGGLAPLETSEVEALWGREKQGFYCTASRGERLADVARRYGRSVEVLARWNGLKAEAMLEEGQMVFVPKQE